MKKKIIALALIATLLSVFLVGCSLFDTDTNRDYHQVLAVVSYDTGNGVFTDVVYKGEVVTYVNAYGASYVSQLKWTAEQVVEYFYNSLTKQKLVALYAQDYLYKNKLVAAGFDSRYASVNDWNKFKDKDPIAAYREFLTADEFRYCIEQANKSFDDNWQKYIKEEEDADKKNNASTDSDESGEDKDKTEYLEARSKIASEEEEESDEYEENTSIKSDGDIVKYFADKYEVAIDASKVSNAYFFNYVDVIVRKNVADKSKYDNMRSALKSVKDDLGEILDYDYFLLQEIRSRIVDKYTDHVGTIDDVVNKIGENVAIRYNKQVELDLKAYVKSEDYSSTVSSGTFVLAAPSQEDIHVKSILLSFSEAQKAAITNLTSLYPDNEDLVKAYRDAIATGIVGDNVDEELLSLYADLGIKVNVSDPDYDADEDELKDAYTDATVEDAENAYANPSVDYLKVLYAMAIDIQTKVNRALTAASDMSDLEQYLVKEYASKQAFNDWINLVNDDGGMFENDFYAVTPDKEATTYVPEYTVLARELRGAGVGATAVNNYADGDLAKSDSVAYDGSTAILKAANGAYKIYKNKATSSVGEDEDEITANIYTLVAGEGTENEAKISFIVNEFGIHIVMVTELPFDGLKGALSERVVPAAEEDKDDVTMYVKGLDYVYDYSVKITYAKDGEGVDDKENIQSVEVEVTSVEKNYREVIKDELSLDVTSLNQYNLFADDDFAKKSDKVFKQIMKTVK